MRFSDLPNYIQKVWTDLKGLIAVKEQLLSLVTEELPTPKYNRLVGYATRVSRQIQALQSAAKLSRHKSTWKLKKYSLESYRVKLEHYMSNDRNNPECQNSLDYYLDIIESLKNTHRAWIGVIRLGRSDFRRLPLQLVKRLKRTVEDIQGTRMPNGSLRYIWDAPEYAQFIPKQPRKQPAWMTVDDDEYHDDFVEIEDGED